MHDQRSAITPAKRHLGSIETGTKQNPTQENVRAAPRGVVNGRGNDPGPGVSVTQDAALTRLGNPT
jgi:hypothetical protein